MRTLSCPANRAHSRANSVSLALFACLFTASAAPPQVTKVEPPDWWVGHSWNPVRVLLHGQHLTGAKVASAPDLAALADALRVSANGQWAFVTLMIAKDAKPGRRELTLTTPEGSTKVPFGLLRRSAPTGRFQGFSPDDVIYLAMPDRFANGNPANDNPPSSPALLDRTKPRHYHGGDFEGVIQHLPYLKGLGVTALWLTPWYNNANQLNQLEKYTADNQRSAAGVPSTDYHGYGAVDFYGVEEHFGDLVFLNVMVESPE